MTFCKLGLIMNQYDYQSCLEIRDYGRRDPSHWPCDTLYPQKLAQTSPTSSCRSVGIVLSWTQAMDFFLMIMNWNGQTSFCGSHPLLIFSKTFEIVEGMYLKKHLLLCANWTISRIDVIINWNCHTTFDEFFYNYFKVSMKCSMGYMEMSIYGIIQTRFYCWSVWLWIGIVLWLLVKIFYTWKSTFMHRKVHLWPHGKSKKGCEGLCSCEMLRIPHYLDSRLTVVRLSALRAAALCSHRNIFWYSFLLETGSSPGP
jgi:hypothetical protein